MTQTHLVTGTSSGIGFALGKMLLEQGHELIGVSRSEAKLDEFGNYRHITVDLNSAEQKADLAAQLGELEQEIDCLWLNAGVCGEYAPLHEHSEESLTEVFTINVAANLCVLNALLSKKAPKQVIAISSGSSKNGSPGMGPYSVSKAALNMLIKTYASENSGTHFSAIAPGVFVTKLTQQLAATSARPGYELPTRFAGRIESGEMLSAEQAAELLLRSKAKLLELPSGEFTDIRDW